MPEQQQTVEDLGKLVKSKYPGVYDSMNDIDVGTKVRAKYPDAYGHFTDKINYQPGMGEKIKNFLVSGDPSENRMTGRSSPDTKKTFEFPSWVNKAAMAVAPLEAGASMMANPAPIMNLMRSMFSGAKAAAPDIASGAARAGVGMAGMGAAEHGMPALHGVPLWLGVIPGLRNLERGVVKGAREFAGEFNPAKLSELFKSESTIPEAFTPKNEILGGKYEPFKDPYSKSSSKVGGGGAGGTSKVVTKIKPFGPKIVPLEEGEGGEAAGEVMRPFGPTTPTPEAASNPYLEAAKKLKAAGLSQQKAAESAMRKSGIPKEEIIKILSAMNEIP